jgi:hypothetical protein
MSAMGMLRQRCTLAGVNSIVGAIERLLANASFDDNLVYLADLHVLAIRPERNGERKGRIKTHSDSNIYL